MHPLLAAAEAANSIAQLNQLLPNEQISTETIEFSGTMLSGAEQGSLAGNQDQIVRRQPEAGASLARTVLRRPKRSGKARILDW